MAKAAPDDANPQPGLFDAAHRIEAKLAAGVAKALASWKDAATPEAIAALNAPGSLFDQLDAPLVAGMVPLDTPTKGGLAAPTPIAPDGIGAPRKLVQFGFNIRNQAVTRYAQQHRYGRARKISDAQRRNIRARYYH